MSFCSIVVVFWVLTRANDLESKSTNGRQNGEISKLTMKSLGQFVALGWKKIDAKTFNLPPRDGVRKKKTFLPSSGIEGRERNLITKL